ncbi:MAG: pyruvate, phosphate dikinase [Pseudomonadota bacterium]
MSGGGQVERLHAVAAAAPARLADRFGARATRLIRMAEAGLPVPEALLLPTELIDRVAEEGVALLEPLLAPHLATLGDGALLSLRASPPDAAWGGPPAILNLGINYAGLTALAARVGERGALDLYRRLIQGFAIGVAGLDAEAFENIVLDQAKRAGVSGEGELDVPALERVVAAMRQLYEEEMEAAFPQAPAEQLTAAIAAMARNWRSPTAEILRTAKGAPADAGLALIVQRMVLGIGPDVSGAGIAHMVDSRSGAPRLWGRFLEQAQGQDALMGSRTPQLLTEAERWAEGQSTPSLEERDPEAPPALERHGAAVARLLGDVHSLEFTLEAGTPWLLDAVPARRSARGAVRIAVDLAEAGAISREDALLRVEPQHLVEHLHPQIDPAAPRDVIGSGLPASPGAATGPIVFTPDAALAAAAQGAEPILVRPETAPEDIRGMHAAAAVLTARGGMTSHAAVIARGLGLPCVVGASDITLQLRDRTLTTADGRRFGEGDVITIDGTAGEALEGAPPTIPAEVTGAFATLMDWADAARTIGVRANADTPQDARQARDFAVDGIGLCRTEHMFFDAERITAMRQMILSDAAEARQQALDRLLPMQRGDFIELFEIMRGLPVTIRLLDPPLHEFLPHGGEEMAALATAMGLPVEQVTARAEDLAEFNPMLGKRGVRLGVTMPEIYEMQARAIFEAAVAVNGKDSAPVVPEIMIPLVSANREVELIKSRIDAVATQVEAEAGVAPDYHLGVMVETPRAALRAADLARSCTFLSFGTNDLTQMTYGLSRDDAGRFMRDYVNQGVFPEDPFHSLDLEGVGELLLLAAARGRGARDDLTLGLCGEHGGDPASIRFCKLAGFDYVSCSPFRVPIARLAAAQASLLARRETA